MVVAWGCVSVCIVLQLLSLCDLRLVSLRLCLFACWFSCWFGLQFSPCVSVLLLLQDKKHVSCIAYTLSSASQLAAGNPGHLLPARDGLAAASW
jgi:hypothetical protein